MVAYPIILCYALNRDSKVILWRVFGGCKAALKAPKVYGRATC